MSHYSDMILSTANLVSYWRLNELSGTTADDAFGTNNGTYTNTPTLGVDGIPHNIPAGDKAVSIVAASSQYIIVPDSADFKPATCTFEGWLKTSTASQFHYIGRKYSTAGFALRTSNADPGIPQCFMNIGGLTQANGVTGVTDGLWHYLAMTYDNTNLNLYVDGEPITSIPATGVPSDDLSDLYLGAYHAGAEYSTGVIDEIAFYSRALTAAEIRQHYTTGSLAAEEARRRRRARSRRIE